MTISYCHGRMTPAVLGAGELELTGEERDRLCALSLGASAPARVAAELGVTVVDGQS